MDELWLVRHGETAWSLSGAHTGRTDLPLTEHGEQQARALGSMLPAASFSLILSSPLRRAHDTAMLAGMDHSLQLDSDLVEWDYGIYEGRTGADIRKDEPGWSIWGSEIKQGESLAQVGQRADRVIERVVASTGRVLVFGHGHMLRILSARWLGLPPVSARLFALDTASCSKLGYEHGTRVIRTWNWQSRNGTGEL